MLQMAGRVGWQDRAGGGGRRLRRVVVVLSLLALACAVNPVTGESELMLVSEAQEIQMGRDFAPQVKAQMGLVDDPALQAWVSSIGMPMALHSERPQLPWSFQVVDDPVINAFAVPGGFVYVTRGILAHMENEAQLAGVLGHEIGHVTARHSARQLSRQTLLQVALAVPVAVSPDLAGLAQAAGSGLGLLMLSYGRDDELQADALGLRYMARAGYDPQQLVQVMRMLDATQKASGGDGVPEWLSTHPAPANRIVRIEQGIASLHLARGGRVDRDAFLRHVDGLAYGEDPRQGYLKGSRFRHPGMRFELDLPRGWKASNTPQALLAASPDQQALLRLTVVKAASAAAAAQAAQGQQGVTVQRRQRVSVHGLPGERLAVQVTGQQGTLPGEVLYVEHGGAVLQLLGVGTAQGFTQHVSELEAALGSFRPLTDRAALTVQPWRLRLERLGRATTAAELLRRHPGPVPADELARLNQVAAGEPIPAGSLAKYVEGAPFP